MVVHRWRLVLLLFVGVALPVSAWTLFLVAKTYDATAAIFIEDSRTNLGGGILRDWLPPNDAILQNAILRSRTIAETVAEGLSREAIEELLERTMHRDYLLDLQNAIRRLLGRGVVVHSPRQRMLAEIQRSRIAFSSTQPGEVRITAFAYNPRVAMELANLYVEVLQARTRSYAREDARTTREFLESSLNQTRAALQEAEEALAKLGANGANKPPERTAVEMTKLAQLENTLTEIQVNKEIAKARLAFLRGTRAPDAPADPKLASVDPAKRQALDRLAQLRETVATLQEKYTDRYPPLMDARAEIRELEARLGPTDASLATPAARSRPVATEDRAALVKQIAEVDLEVSSLEAKEGALRPRIARLSRELSTITADEMERTKLARRIEAQRQLYEVLSQKIGTARMQEQAERPGIRVIDLATLPGAPSNVAVMRKLMMGLAAALGLSVGAAALLEYPKLPVETEAEVARAIGLPVLGWIPRLDSPAGEQNGKPISFANSPDALPVAVESCRSVRTLLELLSREEEIRTIMVTSAGPNEGKSTILLNLGWAFAERGRRVVIVESDLRRPSLHHAFPDGETAGLVDVLGGDAAWTDVCRTLGENLVVLTAGKLRSANPSALLSAKNVSRLVDDLRPAADLILFDAPPVLAVSDNLVLASMVDGVVLVVQSGQTRRQQLVQAKAQLDAVGAAMLGVVLNQVSMRVARRHYAPYAYEYTAQEPTAAPPLPRPWHPRRWAAAARRGRDWYRGRSR